MTYIFGVAIYCLYSVVIPTKNLSIIPIEITFIHDWNLDI